MTHVLLSTAGDPPIEIEQTQTRYYDLIVSCSGDRCRLEVDSRETPTGAGTHFTLTWQDAAFVIDREGEAAWSRCNLPGQTIKNGYSPRSITVYTPDPSNPTEVTRMTGSKLLSGSPTPAGTRAGCGKWEIAYTSVMEWMGPTPTATPPPTPYRPSEATLDAFCDITTRTFARSSLLQLQEIYGSSYSFAQYPLFADAAQTDGDYYEETLRRLAYFPNDPAFAKFVQLSVTFNQAKLDVANLEYVGYSTYSLVSVSDELDAAWDVRSSALDAWGNELDRLGLQLQGTDCRAR